MGTQIVFNEKPKKKSLLEGFMGDMRAAASGFTENVTMGGANFSPGFTEDREMLTQESPHASRVGYLLGELTGTGLRKQGVKLGLKGIKYGKKALDDKVKGLYKEIGRAQEALKTNAKSKQKTKQWVMDNLRKSIKDNTEKINELRTNRGSWR